MPTTIIRPRVRSDATAIAKVASMPTKSSTAVAPRPLVASERQHRGHYRQHGRHDPQYGLDHGAHGALDALAVAHNGEKTAILRLV